MQCVTMPAVKPKVLAPGMYAIDVEPILPRNRNNREVHLDYLKHLKESVETLREIVEEARIKKPLDNALENACFTLRDLRNYLEVAFRKHSCYVRDVDGVELLKGSCGSNLYTISLNHLNFGTINDLARKDLVRGLPRLKFEKDHLCSACQLGKSKKYTHKPKSENTIMEVKFFRTKDETPEFVIKFIKQIQVGLNKTVRYIRTDNGTEFVNQVLTEFYESVGITFQKSVSRTPQQNGVAERQNHILVKAARTMLIFSKALMFLWAEAVATACYTQNISLIHTRHDKTPYELMHDKVERPVPPARAVQVLVVSVGTPSSTTIDQDAPSTSHSSSSSEVQPLISHLGVAAGPTFKDNPFAQAEDDPFVNMFAPEPSSEASSSGDVSIADSNQVSQPHDHL
ncbi:retrovirus-related pol polyprotein from transposon TNT 1-94 [Tanacetum coccineum]